MISNFEPLQLPLHRNSLSFPVPREKSNGINKRTIVQDRRNNLSDRISSSNYQLSSRNVFWTILTNENRPNHTGRSNLTVSSPQESLDISSLPIFKTKAFNPRSSFLEHEQRDDEAAANSPPLFLSLVSWITREIEDSWHGRTSRQWHRVVLHHFWDRYLEAERRHRAAKERTFRGDAAVTTQFSLFLLSSLKRGKKKKHASPSFFPEQEEKFPEGRWNNPSFLLGRGFAASPYERKITGPSELPRDQVCPRVRVFFSSFLPSFYLSFFLFFLFRKSFSTGKWGERDWSRPRDDCGCEGIRWGRRGRNRRNERGHGGEKIAKVRRIKRLFDRRETPVDRFWCSSCSLRTKLSGIVRARNSWWR